MSLKTAATRALFVCLAAAGIAGVRAQALDPSEVQARVSAYAPRGQFTIRSDVKLVEVGVVVRGRDGKPIGGLTKEQFEIKDKGQPRNIVAFSAQTFAPPSRAGGGAPAVGAAAEPAAIGRRRYVAIVFDDLNTDFAEFRRAQVAATQFLKDGLAPDDLIAIFSTYGAQVLPFTTDRAAIVRAMENMRVRTRKVDPGSCPSLQPYEAYLIANGLDETALEVKVAELIRCEPSLQPPLGRSRGPQPPSRQTLLQGPAAQIVLQTARSQWAQVYESSRATLDSLAAIAEAMAKLDGTRMMVLASGGFLSGTLEREQERVVDHALRSNVTINSLDAKGVYTADFAEIPTGGDIRNAILSQSIGVRPKQDSNHALAYLAQSTGGLFFQNSNDLEMGFHQLGMIPEVSYLLAFAPEGEPDGKYHDLDVKLNLEGRHTLQARPGYFSDKEVPKPAEPERRVDREVLDTGSPREIPARIAATAAKTDAGGPLANVVFDVDVRELRFIERGGLRTQRLTLIAALLDERGNFVAGSEGEIRLALKPETYARFAREGFAVALQLEAAPGKYRLRSIVQEANEGKLTAATQDLELQ